VIGVVRTPWSPDDLDDSFSNGSRLTMVTLAYVHILNCHKVDVTDTTVESATISWQPVDMTVVSFVLQTTNTHVAA